MNTLREHVISLTIPAMRLNASYATQLVHDLNETMMDVSGGPGLDNTPRFTIGHLCVASALTVWWLENAENVDAPMSLDLPSHFEKNYARRGPGDRRVPTHNDFTHPRDDLLRELNRQHERIEHTLAHTPEEVFAKEHEWKLGHHLPRTADIVLFHPMHEMLHLGQLAAWRRAQKLPAAMARMAELRV